MDTGAGVITGNGSGLSSIAVANVSGLGNIATLNIDGSSSNVLYGNGVFAAGGGGSGSAISNGNSNVNIATANGNVTVAASGNAIITVTGTGVNIAGTLDTGAGVITGNGSGLSSIAVANVSGLGNIATLNIDGSSSNVLYGNGVFAAGGGGGGGGASIANGTSNVDIASINGNVTVGVGGVANIAIFSTTSMNVAANANITGNLVVQGVSVLVGSGTGGNISGANAITSNSYTANGNVSGNSDVATVTGPLGIRAISSTYTENQAASLVANSAIHAFDQPTLASSNGVTFTNAATFYIGNAPVAGTNATITNPYSLMVVGNSRFFGNIIGTVANGNSNVYIATANGNVTIAAVGNTTLTITGTGANLFGTANISGAAWIGGNLRVNSATGLGYTSSVTGTVAQITSRNTAVTLSNISGAITLFSSTTTANTFNLFTVTNTTVAAADVIIINQQSGTAGSYILNVANVAAGSFAIQVFNAVAVTGAESPIISFAVLKLA